MPVRYQLPLSPVPEKQKCIQTLPNDPKAGVGDGGDSRGDWRNCLQLITTALDVSGTEIGLFH